MQLPIQNILAETLYAYQLTAEMAVLQRSFSEITLFGTNESMYAFRKKLFVLTLENPIHRQSAVEYLVLNVFSLHPSSDVMFGINIPRYSIKNHCYATILFL